MGFEYDSAKSRANLLKHGIDFDQAQALWLDRRLLVINARTSDEPRFIAIGCHEGVYWSAIVTYRPGAVRIISVRRARPSEVELYEGQ